MQSVFEKHKGRKLDQYIEAGLRDTDLTIHMNPKSFEIVNEQLLEMARGFGMSEKDLEVAEKVIETAGYTARPMYYDPGEKKDEKEVYKKAVLDGVELLKESMRSRGWDGLDILCDTAAYLPTTLGEDIVREAGFGRTETAAYRTACSGAAMALVDNIRMHGGEDYRVGVMSIEPISAAFSEKHMTDLGGFAIPTMFGDNNTLILANMKEFSWIAGSTVVVPDNGVMGINPLYAFEKQKEEEAFPKHITFKEGGRGILKIEDNSCVIGMSPATDGTKIMMRPRTSVFIRDECVEALSDLIGDTPNLLNEIGVGNYLVHPGSAIVLSGIERKLKSKGLLLPEANVPFLMDEIGLANSSSATVVARTAEMMRRKMIDPTKDIVLQAAGVGASVVTARIRVRS